MGRRRTLVVGLLALALVLGLAVVGSWLWDRSHRTDLERALATVPASSLRVAYTDWATVRSRLHASFGERASAAAVDAFMGKAYDRDFSAASSINESAGALQEQFGFSPANAQWEVFAQGRKGATMVLRLPDADFDALAGNLRDLGYGEPDDDQGVWEGGIDLVAGLEGSISPELQYVALLADRGLVVTSDQREYAATAAAVADGDGHSALDKDQVDTVASGLGEVANAMVWTGDFACEDLSMSSADGADRDHAEDLVRRAGGVNPLTGFGMGMAGDRALHVVAAFEDGDQARRNLRPRARLAVGEAVGRGGSFADDFALVSSKAVGETVRLVLRPRERTGYVLSALYDGPVLFATC